MSEHLMIVSDAWFPQTNGVVRCLDAVRKEQERKGWTVTMVTPQDFWTLPMPTYPEIRLALTIPGTIAHTIDSKQPDFIHIATEGPLGFAARNHCSWNGLKFTTSYHTRFPQYVSARFPLVPEEVSYAFLRWFHWEAERTLVPTISVANELMDQGFRQANVWTRGIDTEQFFPAEKSMFHDLPGPHLLYVGRVSVEKNIEAFLRASVTGSKIVVGDGPQMQELMARYPEVHFLGRKTGAELTAAYQSADAFVFPSKTDTFGNVMLESLACGTPVAAFPVTGPIDILTCPTAGALDDNLDEAIARALTLPRSAAHEFSMQFTWAKTASIFEANLASNCAPARIIAA